MQAAWALSMHSKFLAVARYQPTPASFPDTRNVRRLGYGFRLACCPKRPGVLRSDTRDATGGCAPDGIGTPAPLDGVATAADTVRSGPNGVASDAARSGSDIIRGPRRAGDKTAAAARPARLRSLGLDLFPISITSCLELMRSMAALTLSKGSLELSTCTLLVLALGPCRPSAGTACSEPF